MNCIGLWTFIVSRYWIVPYALLRTVSTLFTVPPLWLCNICRLHRGTQTPFPTPPPPETGKGGFLTYCNRSKRTARSTNLLQQIQTYNKKYTLTLYKNFIQMYYNRTQTHCKRPLIYYETLTVTQPGSKIAFWVMLLILNCTFYAFLIKLWDHFKMEDTSYLQTLVIWLFI